MKVRRLNRSPLWSNTTSSHPQMSRCLAHIQSHVGLSCPREHSKLDLIGRMLQMFPIRITFILYFENNSTNRSGSTGVIVVSNFSTGFSWMVGSRWTCNTCRSEIERMHLSETQLFIYVYTIIHSDGSGKVPPNLKFPKTQQTIMLCSEC